MRRDYLILLIVLSCWSCVHQRNPGTLQKSAPEAAVLTWREKFDPSFRYRSDKCASQQTISYRLKDWLREIAHTSVATACDRFAAVPEILTESARGNGLVVEVQRANGRPEETLRFDLSQTPAGWAVDKVTLHEGGVSTVIYDASQGQDAAGLVKAAYAQWIPHGAAPWGITHVITYGQSLSQGYFNRPVLSTRQRYSSLKFAGGVRVQDGVQANGDVQAYSKFVPLTEVSWGDKSETPTSGTLNMAMQLIEQENLQNHSSLGYQFLGSAPGEGSMDIASLSRAGPYYTRLIGDMTRAKRLADAGGKSYGVGAITWTQGEADDAGHTSTAAYVRELRRLRDDVDRDAKEITGQTRDIEMITYQLSSNRSFDEPYPHIALALLRASHEDPHIHLAVPMYLFHYVDGRHTDNRSTEWMGAYYGLVLKRLLIDHVSWRPLEPLDWHRDGTVATIRFNVPVPPLRWDTSQVAANTDYGFSLRGPSGELLPIRSIEISEPDTVRITTSSPILAGTHIEYAFSGVGLAGSRYGPRGNLRDSQGDAIRYDDGRESMRLDNWSVIFSATL